MYYYACSLTREKGKERKGDLPDPDDEVGEVRRRGRGRVRVRVNGRCVM